MTILKGWDSLESMFRDFEGSEYPGSNASKVDRFIKVIYAEYARESYEGYATVVFEKAGEYFIVVKGHCSCYGLEGGWNPERTTVKALKALAYLPDDLKAALPEST